MARFQTLEEMMDYLTLDSSGNVSVPALKVNGPQISPVTTLGATGTVSLDPTLGRIFTVTPTNNITLNAASAPAGAKINIIVTTSGTSSFNITFSTNFKSTGVLATGTSDAKVFVVTFVGNGTNMNEVARTTAM